MNELDLQKPLFQLTAGEFLALLKQSIAETSSSPEGDSPKKESKEEETKKRFVYGIAGIAQLFNCSTTTANRIKKSGVINKAISQCGRMITVDADLALSLAKSNESI
jgi:hypothetical protein